MIRRRALAALLLLQVLVAPAFAGFRLCLPPLYEGGQRLHQNPAPQVYWLNLAMRQHELCWRPLTNPDELRVVLLGSSAVFGFPWPVEETFGSLVNQHFTERKIPARLYNLAWANPYQTRDAVIIHEALAYDPDLIIYPVTLSEFMHVAPVLWPPLVEFFDRNRDTVREMVNDPPPGLGEPLGEYGKALERRQARYSRMDWLQEVGTLVRTSVRRHARHVADSLSVVPLPIQTHSAGRQQDYDCALTRMKVATDFRDWRSWNILAYLEDIHRSRGIPVLVVNWPISYEPVDDCYNVRFPNAAVDEFNQWLEAEAAARGLAYLDLHAAVPSDQFLDSSHLLPEGHKAIAGRIAAAVDPLLDQVLAQRSGAGAK